MDIKKPEIFNLHSKDPVGVTMWGNRIATQFNAELFNGYHLTIGDEVWEVRCNGIKVNMMPMYQNGVLTHQMVTYDPITVEFYSCSTGGFQNSELYQWIREFALETNILNFGNLRRNLILTKMPPQNGRCILMGALINTFSINEDFDTRFNLDPMVECEIIFERYEPIALPLP